MEKEKEQIRIEAALPQEYYDKLETMSSMSHRNKKNYIEYIIMREVDSFFRENSHAATAHKERLASIKKSGSKK
jgi:hypothetical protein